MEMTFHATTICAVRHNGTATIAGDGQVTFGESVVMKQTAKSAPSLPGTSCRRFCRCGGCNHVI